MVACPVMSALAARVSGGGALRLRVLDLSHNAIGDQGLARLVMGLRAHVQNIGVEMEQAG
jgi:hypothetical protein